MSNHLAGESSRYLQQHADNPVDWYPWGEEALEKARGEDKPIFLSIGYSACHWCHVMAHESFEDEGTAELLNEHFVSIKVDREERPDLDRIYMGATQAMTGGGGWPMSVFITPDGKPFYAGTYFPNEPRYNIPSFQQVLTAIAEAWNERRSELVSRGEQVVEALQREQAAEVGAGGLDPAIIESAYQALRQRFDDRHGGWGTAPKFPQPMALEFLLRYHHTTGDARALQMVTQTLDAMARGGIYDQLGGGFHRYSVDAQWLTPHFEKMLYDNALLARVYLHAWEVTGEPLFRVIVEETLDYVMREMLLPEGGFCATQDADTEGEEGKFYVWAPDDIREVLGGPASRFLDLYGVTEGGNFEGQNILTFNGTAEEREALAGTRWQLLSARDRRIEPGRDEKVLVSWNGLMLAAFAEAARAFDREDYRKAAQHNATFLLRELLDEGARLWHVWYDGVPQVQGLLEDYTHLMEGLLTLYQTDFDRQWYEAAQALADAMRAHFGAREEVTGVAFYDTAGDVGDLVIRPQETQDNAVPSGNAMAATVLLKLARLDGDSAYEAIAIQSLVAMQPVMGQYPLGFGQWLVALDSAVAVPVDVAVIGDPAVEDTRALIEIAQAGYVPHRLFAAGTGFRPGLLAHRDQVDGRPTAYVCRSKVCQPPVTEAAALRQLLS
jgi:uncharacterized protein